MKRKIYNELLEWKHTSSTKEALLIEGARRIGKSYIVEEFARNDYRSYMLIDFSKVSKEVKSTQRYTTASLDKFSIKFKSYLHTPYVIHSGDLKMDNGIVYLPLYMTPLL